MMQEQMSVLVSADIKPFQAAIKLVKAEMKVASEQINKAAIQMKGAFQEAAKAAADISLSQADEENPFSSIIDGIQAAKDRISEAYDSIKQKWNDCVAAISNTKDFITNMVSMSDEIKRNVENVKSGYNELCQFVKDGGGVIGEEIIKVKDNIHYLTDSLDTAWTGIQLFFMNLSEGMSVMEALTYCLGSAGATVVTFTAAIAAIIAIIAAVSAALIYLWENSEQFRQVVTEAVDSFTAVLINLYETVLLPLYQLLSDLFNTIIMPLVTLLSDVFIVAVDTVFTILLELWNVVLAPIADFLVNILAIALQGVIDIWNSWKPAIETIYNALIWIWEEIFIPIVDWIKEKLIKIFEDWGAIINNIVPGIEEMFQGLIDFFVGIFTLDIDKALGGIRKLFEGFDHFLTGIFQTDWTDVFGTFGIVLNTFFATAKGIWESVKKIFQGIIDFVSGVFSGDWERAWNGIVSIFDGIFQGIAAIVKTPINGVISIINWVIDKVNDIAFDIPDWLPVIGGEHFGLNIKRLDYLAKGGIVDHPILSVIGEAGKEAVLPLENNTGWIADLASQINVYNTQDQGAVISLLQQLIDVVDAKKLQIGDREIGEANQRFHQRKGFSFGSI